MKRWVTNHFEGNQIAEFNTEADMRRGLIAQRYQLPYLFRGTNSVIFNGSIYYHRGGTKRLGRYEFNKKKYDEVEIHPQIAFNYDNVILIFCIC